MTTLHENSIFNNDLNIVDNNLCIDLTDEIIKIVNNKTIKGCSQKEYFKQYYLNNIDKYQMKTDVQMQKNREKSNRWRLKNPERIKENNRRNNLLKKKNKDIKIPIIE